LNIELINTGSELLLGRTLNTHAQWLARRLADRGLLVTRQTTVADTGSEIVAAVREALTRADLVITTGGLGPTSDDLTRQVLAEMLGKKLYEDATVLAAIEKRFAARNRVMPASTRVQALVPEGAQVLPNAHGTAPGLAMEISGEVRHLTPALSPLLADSQRGEGGVSNVRLTPHAQRLTPQFLIMLPGPPRELRPMFDEVVLPLLAEKFPSAGEFTSLTLRTVGLGESAIEDRIAPLLRELVARGLELGYCAHMGQVDVRLAAQGAGREELVRAGEVIVRGELAETIFGTGDDLLEAVVVRALTERKQTLALAESCTGGFIANKITNVPGASAVLLAGLVTYANAAKEKFVGVRAETLAAHGAVSEAVVREMAEGARRVTGADFALAVTGIAGPGGGTAEKPVGTVFLALASGRGTVVEQKFNAYERETFKELTTRQALELLRRAL
jgi:nicotinamide-nucleotide amidase